MNCIDLAHIVTHYVNQKGDTVSHKKLQKLLYYVEAWHLVNFGNPILDEDFEAWVHGPVVPQLYHQLKEFGFNDLKVVNDENDTPDQLVENIVQQNGLNEDQMGLIYSVLDRYGSLTAFELELISHSEAPWIEARQNIPPHQPCNNIISKARMHEYYSSLG